MLRACCTPENIGLNAGIVLVEIDVVKSKEEIAGLLFLIVANERTHQTQGYLLVQRIGRGASHDFSLHPLVNARITLRKV